VTETPYLKKTIPHISDDSFEDILSEGQWTTVYSKFSTGYTV
jgi:hypothetical protein